jgi:hypothetical protein
MFATHLIETKITDDIKIELPLQIESEGVVCYSEEELAKAKFVLDKVKIPYTIKPLSFSAEMKQKVQGIKYNSRSEAIEHIQSNIEPESQRIPNLFKRLNEAEEKNKLIPDLIARLEQAESKISNLQKTIKL